MKNLRMALKAVSLAILGIGAAGCGGAETNAEPRAGTQARAPAGLFRFDESYLQRINDASSKSALASGTVQIMMVCMRVDGADYCEDVSLYPDTELDWDGTVGVWTREYYGDGSFYASFAGTAVTWDQTSPIFQNGVYVGTWRHFTLQNVTSGLFTAALGNGGSDSVYIY